MIDRSTEAYEKARWRVKISHFTEQGFNIKGVVHVGANDGYEIPWYLDMGIERVLAFEPIPAMFEMLTYTYIRDPRVTILPFALSSETGTAVLHVTVGDGKGSSLYYDVPDQTGMVGVQLPSADIQVLTARFDDIAQYYPLRGMYNCCVIDVQGHEMGVLKGFGRELYWFDFFNIECSETPVYLGEAPARDIVSYLADRAFIQDTPIEPHNDVMFVSKLIKKTSDLKYHMP